MKTDLSYQYEAEVDEQGKLTIKTKGAPRFQKVVLELTEFETHKLGTLILDQWLESQPETIYP